MELVHLLEQRQAENGQDAEHDSGREENYITLLPLTLLYDRDQQQATWPAMRWTGLPVMGMHLMDGDAGAWAVVEMVVVMKVCKRSVSRPRISEPDAPPPVLGDML